jgi:uncharacterized RDD family membrane protein YckC
MALMDHSQYRYPTPPPVDAPVSYDPVAPDGRPLAGAGQRFGARVIDSILLVIGIVVPFAIAVPIVAQLPDDSPAIIAIMLPVTVFGLLGVPYLYDVEYPLARGGQTPGKQIVKITVAPLDPGARLTRGMLAKRWLLTLVFNLLANCYVGFLDPLWLLWDKPYRQCLHDKWPRTVVVKLGWPGR